MNSTDLICIVAMGGRSWRVKVEGCRRYQEQRLIVGAVVPWVVFVEKACE